MKYHKNTEYFEYTQIFGYWSVFSCIWIEYGYLLCKRRISKLGWSILNPQNPNQKLFFVDSEQKLRKNRYRTFMLSANLLGFLLSAIYFYLNCTIFISTIVTLKSKSLCEQFSPIVISGIRNLRTLSYFLKTFLAFNFGI